MASPAREVGRLADAEGAKLVVGIDRDLVTIGMGQGFDWALGPAEREEFSRLYFEAERQAEAAGDG